jgi:3-oxoacyl-[acyl-carrier protein] reductase/2-[hydroxy(phenyl)methyl]-succinyl-CoA dehydrogenase BbsC subunit
MEQINDRVALIAGASNNVGEAIVLRLADKGARLAVCDSDSSYMNELVTKITDAGGEAVAFNVKLTDPDDVKNCVGQVMEQFGKIDILVNNPNEPEGKALDGLSIEDFNSSIDINLKSQFYFVHEIMPMMKQKGSGRIINISVLEYLGLPGKVNLSTSTAGILGLTRSLALEGAKNDVTVNNVVKGDIADGAETEEEIAKRTGSIPVKKLGKPDDIAHAVGFFASDSSKYVTGQTFFVCGGKSVHFSLSA